jgi:hypothetical protein
VRGYQAGTARTRAVVDCHDSRDSVIAGVRKKRAVYLLLRPLEGPIPTCRLTVLLGTRLSPQLQPRFRSNDRPRRQGFEPNL